MAQFDPPWLPDRQSAQLKTADDVAVYHDFQFHDRSAESGIDFVNRPVLDAGTEPFVESGIGLVGNADIVGGIEKRPDNGERREDAGQLPLVIDHDKAGGGVQITYVTEVVPQYLYGVSYGTLLALHTMRGYPEMLRSVILEAMGSDQDPKVEVGNLALSLGDRLLLCSDGLTNAVPERRIAAILASDRDLRELCSELLAAAIEGGGPDNVTVVIARLSR